jgi:hypothetical protein
MSPRAYLLAKLRERTGVDNDALVGATLAQLQSLRTTLLADQYYGPFYTREVVTGGEFRNEIKRLDARIVTLGG